MTLPGNPTSAISRILYRTPETFSRRNPPGQNPPLLGRIRETVIGSHRWHPTDGRGMVARLQNGSPCGSVTPGTTTDTSAYIVEHTPIAWHSRNTDSSVRLRAGSRTISGHGATHQIEHLPLFPTWLTIPHRAGVLPRRHSRTGTWGQRRPTFG